MKFQHYTISFYNGYYCQLKKSVFNIDVDEESVYKVPCLQILVSNDFREYLENFNLTNNINEVSEETFREVLFRLAKIDRAFQDRIMEIIELGV